MTPSNWYSESAFPNTRGMYPSHAEHLQPFCVLCMPRIQEEKKAEEVAKAEEAKKAEDAAKEAPPPPPPQEIVLKVFMHCEACAKKVRKSLGGFEGVEDVLTDCKTHQVIVKGEKADPLKVLERVRRKSHRQVELVSPIPQPPPPPSEEKPEVKAEEKKEEPQVISVVLCVHIHCESCAEEITKRIQRMKGVESAKTDLKSSQVTVNGIFDPPTLAKWIHKRTGRKAAIVKVEPYKKEEAAKGGGDGGGEANKAETPQPLPPLMELNKNELYYHHPQSFQQYYPPRHVQGYPPQIFSDENPNACSVM